LILHPAKKYTGNKEEAKRLSGKANSNLAVLQNQLALLKQDSGSRTVRLEGGKSVTATIDNGHPYITMFSPPAYGGESDTESTNYWYLFIKVDGELLSSLFEFRPISDGELELFGITGGSSSPADFGGHFSVIKLSEFGNNILTFLTPADTLGADSDALTGWGGAITDFGTVYAADEGDKNCRMLCPHQGWGIKIIRIPSHDLVNAVSLFYLSSTVALAMVDTKRNDPLFPITYMSILTVGSEDGNEIWTKSFGFLTSPGGQQYNTGNYPTYISIYQSGVYIIGSTGVFGTLFAATVTKLSLSTGSHLWSKKIILDPVDVTTPIGNFTRMYGRGGVMDDHGNLYTVTFFQQSPDGIANRRANIYIHKIDHAGNILWAIGEDIASVRTDEAGNAYSGGAAFIRPQLHYDTTRNELIYSRRLPEKHYPNWGWTFTSINPVDGSLKWRMDISFGGVDLPPHFTDRYGIIVTRVEITPKFFYISGMTDDSWDRGFLIKLPHTSEKFGQRGVFLIKNIVDVHGDVPAWQAPAYFPTFEDCSDCYSEKPPPFTTEHITSTFSRGTSTEWKTNIIIGE